MAGLAVISGFGILEEFKRRRDEDRYTDTDHFVDHEPSVRPAPVSAAALDNGTANR